MTLKEVISLLRCEVLTPDPDLEYEVKTGCGCDLMSDVLAFIKSGSLLLTGLVNTQAIRTAEIAEINAMCFVRGKRPTDDIIQLAQEKGIVLLTTSMPLFEACGRLYSAGLGGCLNGRD